ncbi:hypothetical protein GCK32_003143, partial [Trichostrongylus colubriformis]
MAPPVTRSRAKATEPWVEDYLGETPAFSTLMSAQTPGDELTIPGHAVATADSSTTQRTSEHSVSESSGHEVAATDHTSTHASDVEMTTASDKSTRGELSSDELLATDAEMRSLADTDYDRGSSVLPSSEAASSVSDQSTTSAPQAPSRSVPSPMETEGSPPPRFRAGGFGEPSSTADPPLGTASAPSHPFTSGFVEPPRGAASRPPALRGASGTRGRNPFPPRRGSSNTRGARSRPPRGSRSQQSAVVATEQQKQQDIKKDLPERTPPDFWHYLIDRHPWAQYVKPRQLRLHELAAQQVTNDFSDQVYRHVPKPGYLSLKFARSLFPQVTPPDGLVTATIPFLELPSLEDAVVFRSNTANIIQQALDG